MSDRHLPTRRGLARGTALAGLACLLAIGPVAIATAHDPDPILGGGLFAQNAPLTYRWAAGGTPPAAMRTAINAAAGDSNASRRSKAPTFGFDSGAGNAVYYGIDVPCGTNGLACMRRDAPTWFGVWFRENGHRFDWGTLRWCELSGAPDGCYEIENVMLDELGHVLVLDHHVNFGDDSDFTDAVVQTYSRTKPKLGWNAHAFGRCDVATLQQQYDVPASTTLYSTCLDVPTTLGLVANDTSVVSGSMVTFTATLRTAGTGRLSDNVATGRVVVLQQRTSSGWADVVTMTAGSSGTYTTNVNAWSSRDYRALFRKPSNEGLLASSSATVSVTTSASCQQSPCPQSIGGTTR